MASTVLPELEPKKPAKAGFSLIDFLIGIPTGLIEFGAELGVYVAAPIVSAGKSIANIVLP